MTNNNIKTVQDKFVNALGSGKSATIALAALVEAAIIEGNGNAFNGALTRARKKGDTHAVNLTVRVIKAVFPGAVVKNAGVGSTKPVAVVTKDADMKTPNEALIGLRVAADQGLTMRGKAFADRVFGAPEKRDPAAVFAGAVANAKKAGLTEKQLMQIVANEFLSAAA